MWKQIYIKTIWKGKNVENVQIGYNYLKLNNTNLNNWKQKSEKANLSNKNGMRKKNLKINEHKNLKMENMNLNPVKKIWKSKNEREKNCKQKKFEPIKKKVFKKPKTNMETYISVTKF